MSVCLHILCEVHEVFIHYRQGTCLFSLDCWTGGISIVWKITDLYICSFAGASDSNLFSSGKSTSEVGGTWHGCCLCRKLKSEQGKEFGVVSSAQCLMV